jgi:sodium-dependent dicarboxylate transporter 2/3/5
MNNTGASTSPGSTKQILGIVAAAVATIIVMLLPQPEGLTPQGQRLAAVFVGALVLWGTEALPMAVTALIAIAFLPLLGILTGPNPASQAMATSMSPVFFFVMVMFIIAYAWIKTGLAQRFALWMISRAGTDSRRVVFVLMFGTGLISTIVSDVPCAAIFMAIAMGIFQKLGLQPGKSNFGRVVMLGIPIASLIGGIATPAGSSINQMGLDMIEGNGGVRLPFLHWMALGVPMFLVLLPVAAFVLLWFYPPEIKSIGSLDDIKKDLARLGPLSSGEWKTILLMGGMLTLWIMGTFFPTAIWMNVYVVSLVGAILMFLPGIGLFNWKEAQAAIGWDTLLLIMGITALGNASSSTGLAKWLANVAFGDLAGASVLVIVASISAFTVIIHLVLPIGPVINAVLIPPVMVMANAAGENGALYALPIIFTASCAFLLPLDAVPLVTYSAGYYKFYDMWKPGLIISIVWVIVMTAVMLLFAPMLGLITS